MTGLANKVLDLEVQPDKAGGGPAVVRTLLSLHDPKSGLNTPLTRMVPGPTLTDEIALAGDLLAIVTLVDASLAADVTLTITARALSPVVVTEEKPNNLSINAMPVNNDDEYAGSTFSIIDSAVPTGQIYARVRRGDDAFVTSGKYRLLIFQR